MATYYVSSVDGDNADAGTSWALAKATLVAGIALATSPGDIVYVDSAHSETADEARTFDCTNGTDELPIKVISVNRSTGVYKKMTNTISTTTTTTTSYNHAIHGKAVFVGIAIIAGSTFQTNDRCSLRFIDCTLGTARSNNNGDLDCGGDDKLITMERCVFKYGHVNSAISISGGARVELIECSYDASGAAVTRIIKEPGNRGPSVFMDGCDWTNLPANAEIIDTMPDATGQACTMLFSNCLLPETGAVTTDDITTELTRLEAYNCSTAANNDPNSILIKDIRGETINDNDVYLDSDNAFSLSMVTTSNAEPFWRPHRVLLGEVYAAAGATIGVRGIYDHTSVPNNDECWIEVRYTPITANSASDRIVATSYLGHNDEGLPDVATGTPSALTAGSAWTSTIGLNDTAEFEIDIDLSSGGGEVTTASDDGVVQVWVNWAYYNATLGRRTVYIDSKIVVA